jgi:hypothetical protein
MMIGYLHIMHITFLPGEANTPLVIDSNAILLAPVQSIHPFLWKVSSFVWVLEWVDTLAGIGTVHRHLRQDELDKMLKIAENRGAKKDIETRQGYI